MKNAFSVLTEAAKNKNLAGSNVSCKINPRKCRQQKNNENAGEGYLDNSDDDKNSRIFTSDEDEVSSSPRRTKRIRKRTIRSSTKSESFDDLSNSPKRQRTVNIFAGKTFSLGDDESILQPKPRKSFSSKQVSSINSEKGVVPSIFKDLDSRKADLKDRKLDCVATKQSTIVLPKSIASVTAKEIDRLSGQIIELEDQYFPHISSVSSSNCSLEACEGTELSFLRLSHEGSCDDIEFSSQGTAQSFNKSNRESDVCSKISPTQLIQISEDESREAVKTLESQYREFSIRPMLRRFLFYQGWSNKLFCDMFSASCGDDMLGLSGLISEFSNWLVTYSMATNQMLDTLRKKRTDDMDEEQLWLNAESTCVAIVSGPYGTGKTSFVKAAAADLNYKVIEVNTSQCRSQKQIMSQFRDGSLAHKMATAENDTNSLILVDDADVILAEDSNFLQAICSLAQMSHKPVVLTLTNENTLADIRVSFKQFRLPANRTKALSVLLKCICITKRVTVEDHIISSIAASNNFHVALNSIQLVLQNKIFRVDNSTGKNSEQFLEKVCTAHTISCETYMRKLENKNLELDEETKAEVELNVLSKGMEMRAFSEPSFYSIFAYSSCKVWPGDTAVENSKIQFNFESRFEKKSTENLDKKWEFEQISETYFSHSCRDKCATFAQIYPFIGQLAIVNDEAKQELEAKDHRKMKRYCHYLDACNLGFSNDVKTWLSDFYSFD